MKFKILVLMAVFAMAFGNSDMMAQGQNDAEKQARKEARCTLRGYKAFVDIGGGYDFSDDAWFSESAHHAVDISTSHGFQFNNFFYMGGGFSVVSLFDGKDIREDSNRRARFLMPFFVDFRVNMLNKMVAPVFDARVGYSIGHCHGVYTALFLGVRSKLKQRNAVYGGMELTVQQDSKGNCDAVRFGARIGYEF